MTTSPQGSVSPGSVMSPRALGQARAATEETTRPPPSGRLTGAHLTWVLLIIATIPWRRDVYFDGGLDSVVIAKGIISLVALALALHLAGGASRLLGVAATPVVLLVAYLSVTVIGGFGNGALVASLIVAVRVMILLVTCALLLARYTVDEALRALVHVFAVIAAAAAASGLPSISTGRLQGSIPPIKSNELALLAAVPFIYVFARLLRNDERPRHLVLGAFCAGVVLATGSRSALAALFVALIVMLTRATALSRPSFALVTMLGPLAAFVLFGTDLMASVFLRGGERGVTTLSNRTIAWDAALTSEHDPWETWFGAGLAQKKIPVPGQWWNTQLLDSSWISAIVQGGYLGFAIVVILYGMTLGRALTAPLDLGSVWLGLTLFIGARAVLESGLFDASTAFIVFAIVAFGCRAQYEQRPG